MVDVISQDVETLYRKLTRAEVHPDAINVIIELHEQTRMLQGAVNELINFYDQTLEALKLSQALHRENKSRLEAIQKKYTDDPREIINSMEAKDE